MGVSVIPFWKEELVVDMLRGGWYVALYTAWRTIYIYPAMTSIDQNP